MAQITPHRGPAVSLNSLIKGRPVIAEFEFIDRGTSGVQTYSARILRSSTGQIRSEFEISTVPTIGPIRAVSIVDPIARVRFTYAEGAGDVATEPLGDVDFRFAVVGDWSLVKDDARERIDDIDCQVFEAKSSEGDRLKAWVSPYYGLNVREIVVGADDRPRYEWRLIKLEEREPDLDLFVPEQR